MDEATLRTVFEVLLGAVFIGTLVYMVSGSYAVDKAVLGFHAIDLSFTLWAGMSVPGQLAVKMPTAYDSDISYIIDRTKHVVYTRMSFWGIPDVTENSYGFVDNSLLSMQPTAAQRFQFSISQGKVMPGTFSFSALRDCGTVETNGYVTIALLPSPDAKAMAATLQQDSLSQKVRVADKDTASASILSVSLAKGASVTITYPAGDPRLAAIACTLADDVPDAYPLPSASLPANHLIIELPDDPTTLAAFARGLGAI